MDPPEDADWLEFHVATSSRVQDFLAELLRRLEGPTRLPKDEDAADRWVARMKALAPLVEDELELNDDPYAYLWPVE